MNLNLFNQGIFTCLKIHIVTTKGTEGEISSDSSYKDGNARFIKVPILTFDLSAWHENFTFEFTLKLECNM